MLIGRGQDLEAQQEPMTSSPERWAVVKEWDKIRCGHARIRYDKMKGFTAGPLRDWGPGDRGSRNPTYGESSFVDRSLCQTASSWKRSSLDAPPNTSCQEGRAAGWPQGPTRLYPEPEIRNHFTPYFEKWCSLIKIIPRFHEGGAHIKSGLAGGAPAVVSSRCLVTIMASQSPSSLDYHPSCDPIPAAAGRSRPPCPLS